MNYFGDPWPSGVCDDGEQQPTPLGIPCLLCGEPIQEGDQGEFLMSLPEGDYNPAHRECTLRNVTGGIEHLTAPPGHKLGSCYDNSPLTYRESSLLAWEWVQEHPRLAR